MGLAFWQQLAASLISSAVIFFSTTLLIAVAMKLNQGASLREIWFEKFSWLTLYYLAMGMVTFLLIICFKTFGPLGVLVILGPLVTLRFGQAQLIHKAGMLHDVGKLGILEAILFKPGKLSPQEFSTMQRHTTIGAEILESSYSLHDLIPVVYHHHEHFNGSGYPSGLKGSETSIEARIVAVADAVDAMASDRSYLRGRNLDEITVELMRCSGIQFDPQIVEVFIQLANEMGTELIATRVENEGIKIRVKKSVGCESNNHCIDLPIHTENVCAGCYEILSHNNRHILLLVA